MSIQPIDLQTLFLRLGQIGKNQVAAKNAVVQSQAIAGSEIAQRSQDTAHTVRETDEVSEGTEQVKEEANDAQYQKGSRKKNDKENTVSPEETPAFADPNLGRNVDVSG